MLAPHATPTWTTLNGRSRTKRHTPKVRTGCIVCKARRIKCDERKPACRNCSSSGRQCEGYIVLKPLLFEIAGDADERWAFTYYRDRTSKQICSFQQYKFWDDIVIRAGYSRPAVRHILGAIASFQESADHHDRARGLSRKAFYLDQYQKSMSIMLRQRPDVEDSLLAVILFAFFESICGSNTNALLHLQSGFRILAEWTRGGCQPRSSAYVIEKHLAPVLEQIYIEAASAMIMLPPPDTASDLPDQFNSLKECQQCLIDLSSTTSRRLSASYARMSWPYVDTKIVERGEVFLRSWYKLFNDFLLRSDRCCRCPQQNHHELGVLRLRIQHLAVHIRLQSKTTRSEMTFDRFLRDFGSLLRLLENFVAKVGALNIAELDTCLGFTTNYLVVASFLVFKCRDPGIRRRAIALIRGTPRIEGIWTNDIAADIVEAVVQAEEGRAGGRPLTCADVPEGCRSIFMCTTFINYNPATCRNEISYDTLEPDLIKIKTIRAGIDSAEQNMEIMWLDKRPDTLFAPSGPSDAVGLFAQTINAESNIWQNLSGVTAATVLERLEAAQIYPRVKGIEEWRSMSYIRPPSRARGDSIVLEASRYTIRMSQLEATSDHLLWRTPMLRAHGQANQVLHSGVAFTLHFPAGQHLNDDAPVPKAPKLACGGLQQASYKSAFPVLTTSV